MHNGVAWIAFNTTNCFQVSHHSFTLVLYSEACDLASHSRFYIFILCAHYLLIITSIKSTGDAKGKALNYSDVHFELSVTSRSHAEGCTGTIASL